MNYKDEFEQENENTSQNPLGESPNEKLEGANIHGTEPEESMVYDAKPEESLFMTSNQKNQMFMTQNQKSYCSH